MTPAKKKQAPRSWKKIVTTRPRGLDRAAETAIRDVLKVKKGERVLIVTNPEPDVFGISAALYDAAAVRGADVNIIVQDRRTQLDLASDAVIHAMRSEPEVVLSLSAAKMGKDRFGLEKAYRFKGVKGSWPHIFHALMSTGKTRSFWSPSITMDTFTRTVNVDYAEMRKNAAKLKRALDSADRVHVSSPGGTDLELSIAGRAGHVDDGAFHKPGTGGNLPAGETYISPANYTAQGKIVFDGSCAVADGGGAFVPSRPVHVEIEDGRAIRLTGGAGAKRLEKSLILGEKAALDQKGKTGWSAKRVESYRFNARHLGELGIGLNPKARVTGNMLEDEKILGTCHFAIGANYDDDAEAFIHLDCLVSKPTITVFKGRGGKAKVIMKGGAIQ
jgi:aminopeptidase